MTHLTLRMDSTVLSRARKEGGNGETTGEQ